MIKSMKMFKAALFDLDGVILNTESQYTVFWGEMGQKYFPGIPDFAHRIKGMTLTQIYGQYCPGEPALQQLMTGALNEFERHMSYDYVPGFVEFVRAIREKGVKTAVVTSSNLDKMRCVYAAHPGFRRQFDAILTSEDFDRSKPDPDCYLKAAARLGLQRGECAGFEDSINGLRAVKAARMYCVGLATTNPRSIVAAYADVVIDDYNGFAPRFESLALE